MATWSTSWVCSSASLPCRCCAHCSRWAAVGLRRAGITYLRGDAATTYVESSMPAGGPDNRRLLARPGRQRGRLVVGDDGQKRKCPAASRPRLRHRSGGHHGVRLIAAGSDGVAVVVGIVVVGRQQGRVGGVGVWLRRRGQPGGGEQPSDRDRAVGVVEDDVA